MITLMQQRMKFSVYVYWGDTEIKSSDLKNLIIASKTVDRIVNDVVERTNKGNNDYFQTA